MNQTIMQVYKFRCLLAEQDDFLRDIEIRPGQTFREFHEILVSSTGLSGTELASFFKCDSSWHKLKEITLIDMGQEPEEEDDDDKRKKVVKKLPTAVMDDVKIREVIDDPHQRILYEYDFLNPKVFFIELLKIKDGDESVKYPVCVKKEGLLAVKPTLIGGGFAEETDEHALLSEVDELIQSGELEEEFDENFTPEPEW
jgi:hypothetical protein